MAKLRLLIADDQPLMRAGFRAVLEATGEMEVVAEAGDGLEAVSAARATRPDVVLMDIRMPNLDGIEAIRRLPNHRVLILTTFGLDEYIVEALRAGASGFITKDVPADELVRAVRVVAAGEALLTPAVTRQLLDRVARRLPAPVGQTPESLAELTDREREVLELLARGMSNAEIADALVVGDATVKTHVSNVLMKLGPARPRPGRRAGLRDRAGQARHRHRAASPVRRRRDRASAARRRRQSLLRPTTRPTGTPMISACQPPRTSSRPAGSPSASARGPR